MLARVTKKQNVYPEPFSFKPERFLTQDGKLNPNVQDPTQAFFGFGKRYGGMEEHTSDKADLMGTGNLQNLSRKTHGPVICVEVM
ncbi:hypothetical protein AAF712_012607 [Marasmius tenuissimus]|uniref:Uncharacterized protein n=1 Tax=Marasmius tenuissimus TaxID=585030 RepID=A0ABR2ZHD2_9AGAR